MRQLGGGRTKEAEAAGNATKGPSLGHTRVVADGIGDSGKSPCACQNGRGAREEQTIKQGEEEERGEGLERVEVDTLRTAVETMVSAGTVQAGEQTTYLKT